MAEEKQKTNLEPQGQTCTEQVSDSELFSETAHEDLSVQQIFSGNDQFYKSMDSSAKPSNLHIPTESKSYSTMQKVLVGGVVAAALGVLLHAGWSALSSRRVVILPPVTVSPRIEEIKPKVDSVLPSPKSEPAPVEKRPVSLKVAQDFYQQADYDSAGAAYENLLQLLPAGQEQDLLADFLRLKMALCMERKADYEGAGNLFKTVSQSRCPIVRIIADYHLGLIEMQKRQYLSARSRAYQAIALIDAVDFDSKWTQAFRRNCYFLAAEAISKESLSLSDADSSRNKELPSHLWAYLDIQNDPLVSADEAGLRAVLEKGLELLSMALLAPKIQENAADTMPHYWTVTCRGASIDELMGRFAANAGLDVHWALDFNKTGIRNRPIDLYLPGTNELQLITVAAGCAGLLAALDEKNIITIHNPVEYAYTSEQISLLSTEATLCWQKFLLIFHEDPYLANVHFVLGLLQAQQGRIAESLAEHKMVADRFSKSPLAPAALFNSAQLKVNLQDYSGAYGDLRRLVEQYQDSEKVNQAYLLLAETVLKLGRDAEAVKLYCKLHNLNLSRSSQTATALAAGKIFYKIGDFVSAENWLTEYIGLEEDTKGKDFHDGCFLLGKTRLALGKFPAAENALRRALAGQLSQEDYREAVSVLVESYIQQQSFVRAIELLDSISFPQFPEKDYINTLLLKCKVLRAMGLADNAVTILSDRQEYVADSLLKTEIDYELSECYIEKEEFDLAFKQLTQLLESAQPGPMAHKTAIKLAEVCLRLDRDSQAASICSQLLNSQPPEPVKKKTLLLLAAIYNKQKNYDRAALAILGQWQ